MSIYVQGKLGCFCCTLTIIVGSRGTDFWRPGRRNLWGFSGDTFLAAWPAQPIGVLGGHICSGLAGATYGAVDCL